MGGCSGSRAIGHPSWENDARAQRQCPPPRSTRPVPRNRKFPRRAMAAPTAYYMTMNIRFLWFHIGAFIMYLASVILLILYVG